MPVVFDCHTDGVQKHQHYHEPVEPLRFDRVSDAVAETLLRPPETGLGRFLLLLQDAFVARLGGGFFVIRFRRLGFTEVFQLFPLGGCLLAGFYYVHTFLFGGSVLCQDDLLRLTDPLDEAIQLLFQLLLPAELQKLLTVFDLLSLSGKFTTMGKKEITLDGICTESI